MSLLLIGIGFLCGLIPAMVFIFMLNKTLFRSSGLIRIHPNDEEGGQPYLFLELDSAPEQIMDKKYVIFKVKQDSQ